MQMEGRDLQEGESSLRDTTRSVAQMEFPQEPVPNLRFLYVANKQQMIGSDMAMCPKLWAKFPIEVLEGGVLPKVPLYAHPRMAGVCRNWQSLFSEKGLLMEGAPRPDLKGVLCAFEYVMAKGMVNESEVNKHSETLFGLCRTQRNGDDGSFDPNMLLGDAVRAEDDGLGKTMDLSFFKPSWFGGSSPGKGMELRISPDGLLVVQPLRWKDEVFVLNPLMRSWFLLPLTSQLALWDWAFTPMVHVGHLGMDAEGCNNPESCDTHFSVVAVRTETTWGMGMWGMGMRGGYPRTLWSVEVYSSMTQRWRTAASSRLVHVDLGDWKNRESSTCVCNGVFFVIDRGHSVSLLGSIFCFNLWAQRRAQVLIVNDALPGWDVVLPPVLPNRRYTMAPREWAALVDVRTGQDATPQTPHSRREKPWPINLIALLPVNDEQLFGVIRFQLGKLKWQMLGITKLNQSGTEWSRCIMVPGTRHRPPSDPSCRQWRIDSGLWSRQTVGVIGDCIWLSLEYLHPNWERSIRVVEGYSVNTGEWSILWCTRKQRETYMNSIFGLFNPKYLKFCREAIQGPEELGEGENQNFGRRLHLTGNLFA